MSGSVYEKFGYNLPEKFGEFAEMCSTKFVCGKDKNGTLSLLTRENLETNVPTKIH